MDWKINEDLCTLQIANLNVSYNGISVINNLSLHVKKDEIMGIVGESGVGKTTLIRAINENIEYSGSIEIVDHNKTIYQEDNLLDWFTGAQNITFGTLNRSKNSRYENLEKIVNQLSISGFIQKYPYQMSGGEKKRVALARAFISNPELILMDEPFTGLDIFTKHKMHDQFLNYWRSARNNSTLIISHDVEEVIMLCDRISIMKNKNIEHEIIVPFDRPRNKNIIFDSEFVELRKTISNLI